MREKLSPIIPTQSYNVGTLLRAELKALGARFSFPGTDLLHAFYHRMLFTCYGKAEEEF